MIVIPDYRRGECGSERRSASPKATQLGRTRAGTQSQVGQSRSQLQAVPSQRGGQKRGLGSLASSPQSSGLV